MQKRERLLELGRHRRLTRWPGYGCISDYHGGAYECDFVSPYTKSAENVDASVMVVLQDWSSHEWLVGPRHSEVEKLGRMPSLPTNRNLEALLLQHFGLHLAETYATNLFPFVKRGSMTAPIRMKDLVCAAREFALPQIQIVEPALVICLGKACVNALRIASGHDPAPSLEAAVNQPFSIGVSDVWCQAHTGAIGQNIRNRGGVNRVTEDWSRMASEFRKLKVAQSPTV